MLTATTAKLYTVCFAIIFLLFAVNKSAEAGKCPCDIYEEGGTPCVAAHSTVRALYSAYNGPLYQVRRTSDGALLDIGVLSEGGFVNAAMQDTFLKNSKGTISIIYDQSENKNHLPKSPKGGFLHNGGLEADAKAAGRKVNGHQAYGVTTTSSWDNEAGSVGYRNNVTKGIAIKNQPEGMYMVFDGKTFNEWCCFDYGNAQTDMVADEPAIMETVYFGKSTQWGHGAGTAGPWVMADLEWGLFPGSALTNDQNTPISANYITGMVKGDSTNLYSIRAGDAQSGKLKTMHSGKRPNGYYPMKKEGAIVLGLGGDNSHTGMGIFFEGAMTKGYPTDATEDAVQANIVAAGYGSATTGIHTGLLNTIYNHSVEVAFEPSSSRAIFKYNAAHAQKIRIEIVDQQGRYIDAIENNINQINRQESIWNHRQLPSGLFLWRLFFDGKVAGTGRLVKNN
jgi:hypothetical protein